jgi:lipopolysaccharide export system ATP-binding protein
MSPSPAWTPSPWRTSRASWRKLKQRNIGVLITDHNVQETLSITDRAYLLFEGKILKQGTAEELAADEQVRKVYLGQNFVLRRNVVR